MTTEDHQELKIHNPETCKICKAKQEKTLSEFEHSVMGLGKFSDIKKEQEVKKIANN